MPVTRREEIKKQIAELQERLATEESGVTDQIEKFINGYDGQRLLKEYSIDQVGIWMVNGEDPNCDIGGSHVQPLLGFFEGTLELAIKTAVQLKGFWSWGSGGSITKIEVTKL